MNVTGRVYEAVILDEGNETLGLFTKFISAYNTIRSEGRRIGGWYAINFWYGRDISEVHRYRFEDGTGRLVETLHEDPFVIAHGTI